MIQRQLIRSHNAGDAGTDDNNICCFCFAFCNFLFSGGFQRFQIPAGFGQRFFCSLQNGLTGKGSPAHRIQCQRLLINDHLRQLFNRAVTDARRFIMFIDRNADDFVLIHRYRYFNCTVHALSFSGI